MVVNISWLFYIANTTEKDFLMNGGSNNFIKYRNAMEISHAVSAFLVYFL